VPAVAALDELPHDRPDDRPPQAIALLIALLVLQSGQWRGLAVAP